MSFNWALVFTQYPGASPEEVEKLITIPIEDEIADIDKIDMVTSSSSEGFSSLSIKFNRMSRDKFDKTLDNLRAEVYKVDLPKDVKPPEVIELTTSEWIPMVTVVLSGNMPEKQMCEIAEDLKDEFMQIRNVESVAVSGLRDRQIWVEVEPEALDQYDLALSYIVQSLATENLNVPGGTVEVGREEYILRTMGEFENIEQIKDVIVRWRPDGKYIRIRDIAKVSDTYEKARTLSRLDGKKAISLIVKKRPEGSTIAIIDEIKRIKQEFEEGRLPEGTKINLVADTATMIKKILGVLQNNALFGVLLVLAVLYVFLNWRNALFVALGIPVTFMATFIFMDRIGESVNSQSLFGLVLVLGMIVDDAIVVTENVYRHFQEGKNLTNAVVDGIQEVTWPVFTSSLTTIAALMPLTFMPGIMGQFMKIVPIVVSIALVASLFEVFFILPAHIAEWGRKLQTTRRSTDRLFSRVASVYSRLLAKVIRWRYIVIVVMLIVGVGSTLIVKVRGMELFATDEVALIYARLQMPPDTTLAETNRVLNELERLAMELPISEVEAIIANAGHLETETFELWGTNVGQIIVDVVEREERRRGIDEILDELRSKTQDIRGIDHLEFAKVETGPPAGPDVEVKVKGKHLAELDIVAELLKAELKKIPGVSDVNDDFSQGKKELQIKLDNDRAKLYGLNIAQVARDVRTAFEGEVATVYREGDEAIDVIVKLREEPAKNNPAENLRRIENLKLLTPMGVRVYLREIAKLEVKRGYTRIRRFQRERAITIFADVDKRVTTAVAVNQEIQRRFADIKRQYPGYDVDFRGQFAEFKEAMASLQKLLIVGIILIYIILGAQFKSFIQPLVIMFTVPFAFIGAMFGLLISGYPFSVATMFGIIALAGIVVNDSVVLVDFINKQRDYGRSRWRSILIAARLRLRPILLTTITTIFGLLPMMIGLGGKSPVWMPLANTIVWGLFVATILTLFVIPALYSIVDDIVNRIQYNPKRGEQR